MARERRFGGIELDLIPREFAFVVRDESVELVERCGDVTDIARRLRELIVQILNARLREAQLDALFIEAFVRRIDLGLLRTNFVADRRDHDCVSIACARVERDCAERSERRCCEYRERDHVRR